MSVSNSDPASGEVDWAALGRRCTEDERATIGRIVQRATDLYVQTHGRGVEVDPTIMRGALTAAQTEMCMKILHAHAGVCPMHLFRWLMADNTDFVADFNGISNNLDTRTGRLRNGFWPVFAKNPRPDATA